MIKNGKRHFAISLILMFWVLIFKYFESIHSWGKIKLILIFFVKGKLLKKKDVLLKQYFTIFKSKFLNLCVDVIMIKFYVVYLFWWYDVSIYDDKLQWEMVVHEIICIVLFVFCFGVFNIRTHQMTHPVYVDSLNHVHWDIRKWETTSRFIN